MAKAYTFRDLDKIGRVLKVLLAVGAVLALVGLVSSYLQLQLLEQEFVSDAEADANDAREGVLALVFLLTILATTIAFGMWIYRAHANLRALDAKCLRFTPGWAVGYFFIPILTLWKPYQAMEDLWRASQDLFRWPTLPKPGLLSLWWLFWLSSNTITQLGVRLESRTTTIAGLQQLTGLEMVGHVAHFALCVTAYLVVVRIGAFQAQIRAQADPLSGEIEPVLDAPA